MVPSSDEFVSGSSVVIFVGLVVMSAGGFEEYGSGLKKSGGWIFICPLQAPTSL